MCGETAVSDSLVPLMDERILGRRAISPVGEFLNRGCPVLHPTQETTKRTKDTKSRDGKYFGSTGLFTILLIIKAVMLPHGPQGAPIVEAVKCSERPVPLSVSSVPLCLNSLGNEDSKTQRHRDHRAAFGKNNPLHITAFVFFVLFVVSNED
jgi:hypothetical protein